MDFIDGLFFGFLAALILALCVILFFNLTLTEEEVGIFVCDSHGLGEFKEMELNKGEIEWVSCEKNINIKKIQKQEEAK